MNRTENVSRLKIWIAFGAIYFIWGSTYLAIHYALESIGPFLMMGLRSFLAGGVLYLWSTGHGEKVGREEWRPLIAIAVLFFVIGHGSLAWGQQRVPSGLAALLIASEPLWMALIERLSVRNFHLQLRQITGLIFGFAGIVLLIAPTGGWNAGDAPMLSAAAIVTGAFSWCIGAVYSRLAKTPKSNTLAAGVELMIGGIVLLVIAFLRGEVKQAWLHGITLQSTLALCYLIVFGSIIAFSAYVWLLGVTTATRISTHTYINPLIALFLGWTMADETISFRMLIAAGVIMVSVYLVLRRGSAKARSMQTSI